MGTLRLPPPIPIITETKPIKIGDTRNRILEGNVLDFSVFLLSNISIETSVAIDAKIPVNI